MEGVLRIKEQVTRGSLVLSFLKGTSNPSDLLTKCLGTSAFESHRSCLGFEVIEGSLSSLTQGQRNMVFVELCRERGSPLACEAKRLGIPYMGITHDMEAKSIYSDGGVPVFERKCLSMFHPHVLQDHHRGISREMMNQLLRILIGTRFFHMWVFI